MLVLAVTYSLKKGMRKVFLEDIRKSGLLESIRAEEGCLEYAYYLPEEDEDSILLLEKWASAELQQKHLAQPHMKYLGALKELFVTETRVEKLYAEEV